MKHTVAAQIQVILGNDVRNWYVIWTVVHMDHVLSVITNTLDVTATLVGLESIADSARLTAALASVMMTEAATVRVLDTLASIACQEFALNNAAMDNAY